MSLVRGMLFFIDQCPPTVVRKEGISLSRYVIDLRQTQAVSNIHGLPIDLFTTYYIYILISLATGQCSL